MELTVVVGEDEQKVLEVRRLHLARAGGKLEVVDCALEPGRLLGAVAAPSLFAAQRFLWVDDLDQVSDEVLVAVLEAPSNAVVVARAHALTPGRRKLLKGRGDIVDASVPKGKGVGMRVEEMIRASGVTVDARGRKLLLERVGHDLDRLASVLRQCVLLGLLAPQADALEVLVGSSAAPGVPWGLADAVERGDGATALRSTLDVEAPRAHAYLSNRFLAAARLAEAGVTDVDEAQVLSGVKTRYQAQSLVGLARRLGPRRAKEAVAALARADAAVKTSRTTAALDALVVELSALCRPTPNG